MRSSLTNQLLNNSARNYLAWISTHLISMMVLCCFHLSALNRMLIDTMKLWGCTSFSLVYISCRVSIFISMCIPLLPLHVKFSFDILLWFHKIYGWNGYRTYCRILRCSSSRWSEISHTFTNMSYIITFVG